MRLKPHEVKAIVQTVDLYVDPTLGHVELYLFGSRTDDNKKGGDIDLLLLCQHSKQTFQLKNLKIKISTEIQDKIGEQKIDITIKNENEKTTDLFLQSILSQATPLEKW